MQGQIPSSLNILYLKKTIYLTSQMFSEYLLSENNVNFEDALNSKIL